MDRRRQSRNGDDEEWDGTQCGGWEMEHHLGYWKEPGDTKILGILLRGFWALRFGPRQSVAWHISFERNPNDSTLKPTSSTYDILQFWYLPNLGTSQKLVSLSFGILQLLISSGSQVLSSGHWVYLRLLLQCILVRDFSACMEIQTLRNIDLEYGEINLWTCTAGHSYDQII